MESSCKRLLFFYQCFPIFAITIIKMKNKINVNIIIAISLVCIATVARIINAEQHIYNFVPIAAIGLFSGAILKDRRLLALCIPLAGQLSADVYFNFFTTTAGFYPGQIINYIAIAATAGLGMLMKQPKPLSTFGFVIGSSLLFFAVSNFGYFISGYNGYTLTGFAKTYIDAIPFYKNSMAGDLIGGAMLFGSYFIARMIIIGKAAKARA